MAGSRLHYTVYFDHADAGKTIIIEAAWINPRLQAGPWTRDVAEIIT